MIFVTVGTHPRSFNRLLETVDELIENGKIKDEVVMQIGHSTYEPKNARWFRFKDYKKIEDLNKKARLIISHGGAGCILTALNFGKPVIAVPRLKKFNEHTDDHQIDLVTVLSKNGKVLSVFNVRNLWDAISNVKKTNNIKTTKCLLCNDIRDYLNSL